MFSMSDMRFSRRWKFMSWSSALRRREDECKRWYLTTSLHDVTIQKTTTDCSPCLLPFLYGDNSRSYSAKAIYHHFIHSS